LAANTINTKALNLKSTILRKLNRLDGALKVTSKTQGVDPLDFWCRNEHALALREKGLKVEADKQLEKLQAIMRDYAESYLELAVDYINSGFWDEAIDILTHAVLLQKPGVSNYPTIHYYLGYLYEKKGKINKAEHFYRSANQCPTDYCLPFRLETLDILNRVIERGPKDARVHYYLGNLLYDLQPENAIQQWEKAVELENSLAIAHRNLGWGYYYTSDDLAKAIKSYEEAVAHNPRDPRYYYELDLLYERNKTSVEKRLQILETNHEHLKKREDALIREIMVLVQAGKYDTAIHYLQNHFFHIQEGNRRLHDTYVNACLLRGLSLFRARKYKRALDDFLMADEYPQNHQIGRDKGYRRNPQIYYYIGLCHNALKQTDKAKTHFKKAIGQDIGESEYIYYQGLAYQRLKQDKKSSPIFAKLIQIGKERLKKKEEVDFFAKFGQGRLPHVRQADAHYMIGLGYLGKRSKAKAKEEFRQAVKLDVNNIWAKHHLAEISR
jgi:tetratricopeptide (TPR) repeat protein